MPAGPGENRLTTLFADVHYYLSDPSAKPLHHRFSRGSYLYVHHNPTTRQAKVEIANHAGTPEQDAFSGSLGVARVEYSHKHPTLLTLKVNAAAPLEERQWHLPSYDLRNEGKYLYKLHSLDVYLWTEKDAATLLRHFRSVMPASSLDIRDAPLSAPTSATTPAEHRDSMSPVVQQLEQTAISAHLPPQRTESVLSVQSFPGPPTPAISPPMASTQGPSFAYNPAAPPAPEPIAYREKTPPPPEDGQGVQYAGVPPGYAQNNSNQVTPQHAYFAGPPQQTAGAYANPPGQATSPPPQRAFSSGLPPPPPGGPSPAPQQQYAPSFGPPPTSPPPGQLNFAQQRQSSYGGGMPGQTQFATYPPQQHPYSQHQQIAPGTPSFGPFAAQSPGMPPSTPGYQSMQPPTPSAPPSYAGHTPLQSPGLPPPPPGQPAQQHGYSNYEYTPSSTAQQAGQHHNVHGAYTGDVHSQVYRPTETENSLAHTSHGHGHSGGEGGATGRLGSMSSQGSGVSRPGMQQRVSGVEKRVGGLLKRLDKFI